LFDNTTLGTTENTFGYNFSLYPNPAQNGRFYIATPGLSGTVDVTLTNVLGQQDYDEQLDVQNQEVQIIAENLSSGVYMLNLSQGEQSFSTKVIIE
jgi:ABC-type polysaccharide transport system permease subunit